MNKLNFDGMKSIKAPREWIDKAAVIPQTHKKQRAAFPVYRAAAAAVVALVTVIGQVTFTLFNRDSVPVAPPAGSPATEATQPAGVGETDGIVPTQSEDVTPTEVALQPTEKSGQPVTGPAVSPTAPHASETPSPTESPTGSEPAPTQPIQPTQPIPTTEPISPTAPPQTDPPKPTEPPVQEVPTEASAEDYKIYAVARYPFSMPEVEIDEDVFCCLYDSSGSIVGSSDLYVPEKRAEVVSYNPDDSFDVTYDPHEKGLPVTRGQYEYVFYGLFGIELCRGTVWY